MSARLMTSKMSSSRPREFILRRRGQAPTKGTNMERHFDEELKNLKQKLLAMADTAQQMIGLSVKALTERDQKLTEDVFALEDRVNHTEIEIEEEVLRLLALRQPAAGDLRLLTAILKINNDLERVADPAVNIFQPANFLFK